jgi:hypothetical protein
MKCPFCNSQAVKSKYGYLPCNECQEKHRKLPKARPQIEWTSQEIKDMRKAHYDDIVQPFRGGELSKEYVDRYGTKGIKTNKGEAKKARPVWDDKYYKQE